MKCDNLPRPDSCGWLESSGGRQLGLWGQQSHHLGRESWSWSHPRGWVGGDVFKPKTKIINTKAKSKNKSHHLGARRGLCSGQEEVGEGGSTQEDESKTKNFWSSTRPRPWVQQDQDQERLFLGARLGPTREFVHQLVHILNNHNQIGRKVGLDLKTKKFAKNMNSPSI